MAKKTPLSVSSGFASQTQLNAEFADIADHLNNKVLYRDNPSGEANQMGNDLDMNSNRVMNLPAPGASSDAARLVDISDSDATGAASAQLRIDLASQATNYGASLVGFDLTNQTVEAGSTQQVAGITALKAIAPVANRTVYLKYHTTAGDGGHGHFRALTGAAPGTYTDDNGITIVPTGGDGSSAWRRVYSGYVDAKAFGAKGDGITDDSVPVLASIAALGYAYLSEGNWYISAKNIDTTNIKGPGAILAETSSGRKMLEGFRKDFNDPNKVRFTFEDEYNTHYTSTSGDLYYTAFGSSCLINGHEVYAARIGYSHESNFAYQSAVVLYFFSKDAIPVFTKSIIYTTTTSEDVRDVNITTHPTRNGIVLIRFAELLSTGTYQTRLITYNVVSRTIESNRLISGPTGTDFSWGNSLITPQGYLLFCTYRLTGGVDVWRTTTALPTSGAVTATIVSSLETGASPAASEATIGYWNDRIVLVYRREAAAGRLVYSFDLENPTSWSTPVLPTGGVIHGPCIQPYNLNSDVCTIACSLGSDRTKLSFASTTDFNVFKAFSTIETAGVSATGGYPSLLDMGGYYAVSTYSDWWSLVSADRRSRFERMEVQKKAVDISYGDYGFVRVVDSKDYPVDGQTGIAIGNVYMQNAKTSSDGRNYSTEFFTNRSLSISAIYLQLHGTSTITAELYEDGVLLATSSSVAIATTSATPVALPIGPTTLSLYKTYRIKILGTASFTLYDYRHNFRRAGCTVRFNYFYVKDTKDAAGASLSNTLLIIPAFQLSL